VHSKKISLHTSKEIYGSLTTGFIIAQPLLKAIQRLVNTLLMPMGGDKMTERKSILLKILTLGCVISVSICDANAASVSSTVTALRLSNTITGGAMPTSDPLFQQMVTKVDSGDLKGAADIASHSKYFASYLARRMAMQMQNPSLDAANGTDNDATAFIIAHFAGAGANPPSISTIWSENATYLVTVTGSTTPVHAADLTPAQLATIDWSAALTSTPGQNLKVVQSATATGAVTVAAGTLPAQHVGGYITLSDRPSDNSFAQYGATAGTNLRMIEGLWEVATGLTLVDAESSDKGQAYMAPRFVPESDPNFFHGQGQTACLACHGGGLSSIEHGYSAVADVFNFDGKNGLTFNPAPTTATMKSLGSDPTLRASIATCDVVKNPKLPCNPDSANLLPNQGWDLSVWNSTGLITRLGWSAPLKGNGLNSLGVALGQASIVYRNLAVRVINEICPLGAFTEADLSKIVAAVSPSAIPAGTDDLRTIVSMVAVHPTCQ
jgi:hypothetical protein